MTALFPPTDSILRRHFDQIAASAGLPPLPEDSVLRRHHAQLLESRLSARRAPVVQQTLVREVERKTPEPAIQRVAQPSLRPIPPRRLNRPNQRGGLVACSTSCSVDLPRGLRVRPEAA